MESAWSIGVVGAIRKAKGEWSKYDQSRSNSVIGHSKLDSSRLVRMLMI